MENSDKDRNNTISDLSSSGEDAQNAPDGCDTKEAGDISSPASSVADSAKKTSGKEILRYLVIFAAVLTFAIAAVKLCTKLADYKRSRQIYDDASEKVVATGGETEEETSRETSAPERKYDQANGYKYLEIDFDALHGLSSEAVGWINIPSLKINYPIVQHSDNEFYLHRTYSDTDGTGDYTDAGSIFLDYRNSAAFDDGHFFIYGHHMYDDTMFTGLLEYDSKDFYDENDGNNVFYIYTPDCIRKYQIFCVTDASSETQKEAFYLIDDSFSINDYVDYLESIALYDTGVDAHGCDSIATLYTCQTDSKSPIRHLVHGMLVETVKNNT